MLSCLHFVSCSDTGMIKMQLNRNVPAVAKPLQPSAGIPGWTFSCCINVRTTELSWTTSIPPDYNFVLSWKFSPKTCKVHAPSGRNPPDILVAILLFFSSIVWTPSSEPTLISRMIFWSRNQTYTKSAQFLVVSGSNQTLDSLGKIQCQSFSRK